MPSNLPDFDVNTKFTSLKSIEDVSTLNKKEFKELQEQAAAFLNLDDSPINVKPRSLSNKAWAAATDEFLNVLHSGNAFWHENREGFDRYKDLLYPRDTKL